MNPLEKDWNEFLSHWDKARRGKADSVHQVRVVSRRLVAALELLIVLKDDSDVRRLRRNLRKLIRRLGKLRDIQVQQSLVEKIQPAGELRAFRRHLKRMEDNESRNVHDRLNRKAWRKLQDGWKKTKECATAVAFNQTKLKTRSAVRAVLRKRSARATRSARDFDARDMETVHAFRIASKKLRYAEEAAHALFAVPLPRDAEPLRERQKRIGEIRDLEMVRLEIQRWVAGRKGRSSRGIRIVQRKLRNIVRAGVQTL